MDYKVPTRPAPLGVISKASSTIISAPTLNKPSATVTSASAAAAGSSSPTQAPQLVQEYSLRVPKTNVKPVSIMRFNGALNVDPSKWTHVKMAREDNSKLHKNTAIVHHDEDMPKFGAGSEYGREAREEARKRKYGSRKHQYNPDDQPWLLKVGDKTNNRKYKGVREGGVTENASYFIFTQAPDGAFEVFPVKHWYNFTPIQRYKSLTSEEAEQEFGRRNKILNYFSVMVRRRLKADDDSEEPETSGSGGGKKAKKASSDLKVSEMEDWADSDDDEEMSGDDDEEKAKKKSAKAKKGPAKNKKKKGSDDEGLEDSDDGDEEGRELDYISDTSGSGDSEPEKEVDIKGVDQEEALRDLLESGSESEEEGKEKKDNEDKGDDEAGPSNKAEEGGDSTDKKKKKKKKDKNKDIISLSDGEHDKDDKNQDKADGGDSSKQDGAGSDKPGGSGSGDGPNGNSSLKRKASADLLNFGGSSSKKAKMEVSSTLLQNAASEGITEEAVRRYLLRKPMTVTELLHKFKSKKTKIASQDMVNVIAHILKKINPVKRMQNQKMYLYLTAPKT